MAHGHELVFDLPALPERVWDALTNPAKLTAWFGETDLAPQVGRRFTLVPHAATGLSGPIAGEVTAVEEDSRIVMRWRTDAGDIVMTWLVDKGRGGTRLRVIQSSVLGGGQLPDSALAGLDAYQPVFDEQLRGFLRAGIVGRISPPPRPSQRPPVRPSLFDTPGVATPEPPPEPDSQPVARFGAIPAEERRAWEPRAHRSPSRLRRGSPLVLGLTFAVVLALVLSTWAVASSGAPWGAPGPQGAELHGDEFGEGPDPTGAPSPGGPGGPGGPGDPAAGGPSSDGTAAPGGSTGPASAVPIATTTTAAAVPPLAITHTVAPGVLQYTATITVTNPADVSQTWQSAKATLSGVALEVSNVDDAVTFEFQYPTACFTPSEAIATVPAGGSVSFSFDVGSVVPLGTVSEVSLADSGC